MNVLNKLFEILRQIDSHLIALLRIMQQILEHFQGHSPFEGAWLDNQDVMQKLKISESTLKRHRLKGVIRSTRIGGKYYYDERDIEELLKEGKL